MISDECLLNSSQNKGLFVLIWHDIGTFTTAVEFFLNPKKTI
jgi:hypothetical protein